MGKRLEKAFARDKNQSTNENQDEDPKKLEPYTAVGLFQTDFFELARRTEMSVVPPVVLRPHRPPSPSTVPPPEEKGKGGKKDDKKNQPPPEPEPSIPDVDENGEPIEPPPKTYTTKDKFTYFKPTVQVEMDNPDKQDTITEIHVKGWRVNDVMMNVFKECFLKLDRLHTISLWNVGLTDDTLTLLAATLNECANMKSLVLDNNPVKGQGYHLFLKEESPIVHLSLRYNNITDEGADLLATALGTAKASNQKLHTLNLNGNLITDKGMDNLARGLRMNRTLIILNVANNKIGDEGVKKIAEVLSRFQLTHEEIVERRKLLSEKGSPERTKSGHPSSRRGESRDRPGSVRSHAGGAASKSGKSAKNKKDGKGKDDDKHDKSKGKKDADKGGKKGAAVNADAGKGTSKKADKGKGKGKGAAVQEQEISSENASDSQLDALEITNPLHEPVEKLGDGVVMLPGNRALVSLNLAYNNITEEGVKALMLAIGMQSSILQLYGNRKSTHQGLMRLCLNKNKIDADNEVYVKLKHIMETKEPFYKPPVSPDQESAQELSPVNTPGLVSATTTSSTTGKSKRKTSVNRKNSKKGSSAVNVPG